MAGKGGKIQTCKLWLRGRAEGIITTLQISTSKLKNYQLKYARVQSAIFSVQLKGNSAKEHFRLFFSEEAEKSKILQFSRALKVIVNKKIRSGSTDEVFFRGGGIVRRARRRG